MCVVYVRAVIVYEDIVGKIVAGFLILVGVAGVAVVVGVVRGDRTRPGYCGQGLLHASHSL